MRKNPEKRKKIAHIIAGFVILVHAYERFDSGHSSYIFFAIAGVTFLTVALLHTVIEKKAPWVDGVFLVIESVLSMIIAYEYLEMGKKALPFSYALAGTMQLILAFVKSKKGIAHHKARQQAVVEKAD